MKRLSIFVFGIALATAPFLSSCADKMSDQHSAMAGGNQGDPNPKVADLDRDGTPSNTNGKGQPMASGKVNTVPDTMWNQSSPAAQKPF